MAIMQEWAEMRDEYNDDDEEENVWVVESEAAQTLPALIGAPELRKMGTVVDTNPDSESTAEYLARFQVTYEAVQ